MTITKRCVFNLKSRSILLLAVFLLLINFLISGPAMAESGWLNTANKGGLDKIGQVYDAGRSSPSLVIIVANIIKVFISLLGVIFLVLLVLAGYKWMMAGGNEDKVKEALSQIKTAIIGLAIILAAYAIATFVFNQLIFSVTGYQPY